MSTRSFVAGAAMLLAVLGCRDETTAPTQGGPALQTRAVPTIALGFRQVSAGWEHTCAVTTDYRAYCWGSNRAGQLGNGAAGAPVTSPVAVQGGLHFRQVSAGVAFTCGVTTDNRAYCWGSNNEGQLGDGTTDARAEPVRVAGDLAFRKVSTAWHNTCGVTTDDHAYCWGNNGWGQLGDGTTLTTRLVPVAVARHTPFSDVDAGYLHTCGVSAKNQPYCWGDNSYGELGVKGGGPNWQKPRSRPTAVTGRLQFRQVHAGHFDTCGVTTDSRGYCWGDNSFGKLGNGLPNDDFFREPSAVAGDLAFRTIDPSLSLTCGVTTGNDAYCWGAGTFGNGSRGESLVPVQVTGGLQFGDVSTGYYHACGLTTDGQVYCWGANFDGQLGDGTTTDQLTPTPVADPL